MGSVGRLGDRAKANLDTHGCPACPHVTVQGPAIIGSMTVCVNKKPVLRVGDCGIHAACCSSNTWIAMEGSGTVLVEGLPLHRKGDKTRHCGGQGLLIEGSNTVYAGGPSTVNVKMAGLGFGLANDWL